MKNDFKIDIEGEDFEYIKEQVLKKFRKKLEDKNLNASGTLSETTEVIFNVDDRYFSIQLNLPDYYKFTDKGVNGTEQNYNSPFSFSGKPIPVSNIKRWIEIKPVIPFPDKKGRIPSTNQLAYAMSHSIPKKGIEPRDYIYELKEEMNDIKDKIIETIYQQLIKNLEIE